MSSPKIRPTVKDYKDRARILKKFGLLDINLREKITPAQKARITKLTARAMVTQTDEDGNKKTFNAPPLKALIKNPELFKTRKVSKKDAKKWREAGYQVINGRVIVRGEKGAKISITKNKIKISRNLIVEDVYLFGSKNFFKIARDLLSRQMGKDEYILGRFGNYGNFKTMFVSYEDFYRYVADRTDNFTNALTKQLQLVHQYRK